MSNSLDPDQTKHFVGPDLGPNGLQRLLADDTRAILKIFFVCRHATDSLKMVSTLKKIMTVLGGKYYNFRHFLYFECQ